MKILNLHGFMGEADNKNYKALCGIVLPENIISPQLKYKETSPCVLLEKLSELVVGVHGSHSIIENVGDHISELLAKI